MSPGPLTFGLGYAAGVLTVLAWLWLLLSRRPAPRRFRATDAEPDEHEHHVDRWA
jgi:nitrate reductase gamma subunit